MWNRRGADLATVGAVVCALAALPAAASKNFAPEVTFTGSGNRFWSHLDTFIDPDPHGPPVLYVYRTVRNPRAPGGAEFVPELIHDRSGIGSAAAIDDLDLDKDGAPEIITSTKRGTFIFWNHWGR